jgi:hypothetical protein
MWGVSQPHELNLSVLKNTAIYREKASMSKYLKFKKNQQI